MIGAEEILGLEAYEVTSFPDQPLSITQDLFFDQIVHQDGHAFRQESIFAKKNDTEEG